MPVDENGVAYVDLSYSWEQLHEGMYMENNINYTIKRIRRTLDNELKYKKHKEKCERLYGSLVEHIRLNVMSLANSSGYVIVENTFPYNLSPEIGHDILWSKRQLDIDDINEIIKKDRKYKDYFFFENENKHKSIPEVHHVHIMFKKEDLHP